MRTTVALDDELLAKAQALTGVVEKSALVREALKALVERECARRLARLGGTEPELAIAPRQRGEAALFLSTARFGSNICGQATAGFLHCSTPVGCWPIPW